MNPADIAGSPESDAITIKSGTLSPTIVSFVVSDPEVLIALSEYPEGAARTNFLATALKVGVLSLKAARGSLDSDTLRREGIACWRNLGPGSIAGAANSRSA